MKIKEIVINKVVEHIENKKILPWHKPWISNEPGNIITGNKYHGFNRMITSLCDSPFFITFKQANDYSMKVKKGSKSIPIIYFSMLEKENKNGEKDEVPMMKYYSAFPITDIDENTMPECIKKRLKIKRNFNNHMKIKEIEEWIIDKNIQIQHKNSDRAYYSPNDDYINIPSINYFETHEDYYSTLFHEMSHWTGHRSRLNRLTDKSFFGTDSYSKEELIAEMSSIEISIKNGINPKIDNSAAYLQGWCHNLKKNINWLFEASKKSEEVIDFLF